MKVDTIQTSFAGGEFGPSLYGRTDVAHYQNACEIVENFLVRSYGPAISTPGTRYVATVSDSTLNTRLLKFVFNRNDSYAIEAGNRYMRFFTNRGQVITASGTENLSSFGTDLISQYKLNDNSNSTLVIDSKAAHNGTASTLTSTLHATGKVGTGCFDFNNNQYVIIPDHIDFTRTAATQPMSIAAWVYYEQNGDLQTIMSKWGTDASEREWLFAVISTDKLLFQIYDEVNAGASSWTAQSVLQTGWNFVALTFSGAGTQSSHCAMYINGAVVTTTFVTGGTFQKMVNGTGSVGIGARNLDAGVTSYWANKIDEVSFFHKVLSAAEVSSLYTSSNPYQISTVYTESEISDIHYAQLNDIIWFARSNHPPQQLTRAAADEWTIADFDFEGGPFLDENTDTSILITPSATSGTINITVSPTNSNLFTVSSSTLGHHDAYWMIGGLAQTVATTGIEEYGYVQITHVINSYTATATVIKNLKAATATSVWAEGAWSAVRGYPARVAFHERRLWFARTSHEPQKAWGSKVFEYNNFALGTQLDDDALSLALSSNESNEIQWLSSGKSLVAGTYGGAFVINSGSSDPITPSNANALEEVGYGSEDIMPRKIGNLIYYIQRFGTKLREMFYFWDLDTHKAVDKTILSPHILGDGVIDMDVQQNPETVIYCVLTNGTLATMTREVDQELTAWSRQTTAGTYTSIAVIPSQSYAYDEAWVIVERWINGAQKKYVEYFENIIVPSRQDQCLYLHSALTYDAYEKTSLSSCTISLSASSGTVTLTASTGYFTGTQINKRLRAIDADGDTLGEGVITATASTTSLTLSITTTFSALAYSAGRWGISVASVSGLTHLEAKTIGILADGKTESLTRTVASGAVTLGSNYFVVTAGLSYDQILYTLPKEAGTNRGTAQGKFQRINEVVFKLNRSTQGFKYGTDEDHTDDANLAFTPTVTTLYTGIVPPQTGGLTMRGGYSRGAQVYIKNANPLPMEVLSIISSIDTYDK